MALLQDKDREVVQKEFSKITHPVVIKYFTSESNCMLCKEVGELLDEVSGLHDQISLETYASEEHAEMTALYSVDKYPSFVVTDEQNRVKGIRFFGIPAGYEFVSLMGAILTIGTKEVELPEELKEAVMKIDTPVHIQVFVTPTCPYCPPAVRVGHQMAMLNSNIKADMIEATEFAELSRKYRVQGVPRVVVNDDSYFEGALPEAMYVDSVQRALGGETGNLAEHLH